MRMRACERCGDCEDVVCDSQCCNCDCELGDCDVIVDIFAPARAEKRIVTMNSHFSGAEERKRMAKRVFGS